MGGEMKAISFYSVKGGTGRSLALANVATYMANKGKKVLCIDLDIQAPGLYALFEIPMEAREKARTIVDILLSKDQLPDMRVVDVSEYLNVPQNCLFVIPTFPMSRDELLKFQRQSKDIWASGYFATITDRFLKPLCALKNIEYIFIDSRSGIVEEAMVALTLTGFLAQKTLCLLFTRLDTQSRKATYHAITLFDQYQYDIPTKVVISNIPMGEKEFKLTMGEFRFNSKAYDILVEFDKEVKKLGKEIIVSIPFDEHYLLEHKIITVEERDMPLYNSYKMLAEYIEKI